MINAIVEKTEAILLQLSLDEKLYKYIDITYRIPKPHLGQGSIKLIVLGQDPTIKNVASRGKIKTVLNLDTNGSVRGYLSGVCQRIGIDLNQNVYATNLYKNFFSAPPTQIKEVNIFQEFLSSWLPLLEEELAQFKNAPVITLGESVLRPLLKPDAQNCLRKYWGYTPNWKFGQLEPLQYLKQNENLLDRIIFPFPHQPSLRKAFYKKRMNDYIDFVKVTAFSA